MAGVLVVRRVVVRHAVCVLVIATSVVRHGPALILKIVARLQPP
jgi:hypothetical protein